MNRCLQISKFESITLELWQFNDDYEVHLNIPGRRIEMMTNSKDDAIDKYNNAESALQILRDIF